ncbi:MAG: sulfotransferase [Xanthomonadales bacterium]|nr:sulfotransferase [Xanthomonadales bacterium]
MDNTLPNAASAESAIQQQLAQGFAYLQHDQFEQANQLADQLLAAHAQHAEVAFFASEARLAMDDAESALRFIDVAIEAAPGQLPLLLNKAETLMRLRRRREARQVATDAVVLAGSDGQALWAIGKLFSRNNDPTNARPLYEQALTSIGHHPDLLYDLAIARYFIGDVAGAEQALEWLLAVAPKAGHALYLRATLKRQTQASNHVADLESRLRSAFPNPLARAGCLFALAKECEDLDQAQPSFAALAEANALKHASLTHDAGAECASIDAVRDTYTSQVMQAPTVGHEEAGPIFIVGMPRTGTTLVERMLGRHSAVRSAGELLDFGQLLAAAAQAQAKTQPEASLSEASLNIDFAALGRAYMLSARDAAGGSTLFIDKMPINYIYCGLIKKALPQARIIHLVRSPMDACYAAYKTWFNQAYYFSYDMDELATYFATYQRMMQHWHTVMPGVILDIHYEQLVTDTETQARRISDHCGLDWQEAVLNPAANDTPATTASAAQVRQPVHSGSVDKWRRYESQLAPLKARLMDLGIVDVDGNALSP